jgi:anti-sigma B factor antagonist
LPPAGRPHEEFRMQIEERVVNDVTILDLKGKITLGEGDEALREKINNLISQNKKRILLNLADVPYIDSAGLGEVVRTYTTVSRQGGQLKLVNLTKRITDLLSITKLLTVFEAFESETEALKSYS